jgi:branched-subunit amino acid aminotransferase/4-amino-4-deoxychorismate lyase
MITKAAKEGGVDFAVTWDENGFLAEGSTENILLVSPEKELLIPEFDRILQGITLTRVMELTEELVLEGYLKGIKVVRIDRATAAHCLEVMLCGTSLDVLPVRKWDGRTIGQGRPGPVFRKLNEVLRHDIESNPDLLTPMFE